MARFDYIAVMLAAPLAIASCVASRPLPDTASKPVQVHAPPVVHEQQAPAPAVPTPPAPPTPPPKPAPSPAAANRPGTKPNMAGEATAKSTRSGAKSTPPAATVTEKATPPPAATAATLDLGALEQKLKDTRAIGVFTKLSLKNQVDDLLSELRAFHGGSSKTPQAELRQKYDTLIIKVLTLLQNGDPQLATAVASSREALWGILMDPKKFSQI